MPSGVREFSLLYEAIKEKDKKIKSRVLSIETNIERVFNDYLKFNARRYFKFKSVKL